MLEVITTVKTEMRESTTFATLKEALDFCAELDKRKVRNVNLNVNFIFSPVFDKYGRLPNANYPWSVSYPAA